MLRFFVQSCAALAAAAVAQLCLATIDLAQEADKPMVTLQPDPARDVMPFYRDWTKSPEAEPRLTREQTIERLRAAVKYVFVIFHENESFDHYFGTFPGANGIHSDLRLVELRAKKWLGILDDGQLLGRARRVASGDGPPVRPEPVPLRFA